MEVLLDFENAPALCAETACVKNGQFISAIIVEEWAYGAVHATTELTKKHSGYILIPSTVNRRVGREEG